MDAWFSRHCIAAHSRNNSRVLSAWTPLETSTLNGGFFDAVQKYATRAGLVCGERSTDRVDLQQVGVLAKFTRLLIIRRGGAVRIQWPWSSGVTARISLVGPNWFPRSVCSRLVSWLSSPLCLACRLAQARVSRIFFRNLGGLNFQRNIAKFGLFSWTAVTSEIFVFRSRRRTDG